MARKKYNEVEEEELLDTTKPAVTAIPIGEETEEDSTEEEKKQQQANASVTGHTVTESELLADDDNASEEPTLDVPKVEEIPLNEGNKRLQVAAETTVKTPEETEILTGTSKGQTQPIETTTPAVERTEEETDIPSGSSKGQTQTQSAEGNADAQEPGEEEKFTVSVDGKDTEMNLDGLLDYGFHDFEESAGAYEQVEYEGLTPGTIVRVGNVFYQYRGMDNGKPAFAYGSIDENNQFGGVETSNWSEENLSNILSGEVVRQGKPTETPTDADDESADDATDGTTKTPDASGDKKDAPVETNEEGDIVDEEGRTASDVRDLTWDEWLSDWNNNSQKRDNENYQQALEDTIDVYGSRDSIAKPFDVAQPNKSDYIWNKEMLDHYFPTIEKAEEEKRERQAQTAEWITRLGEAVAALGNVFTTAGGAVSQKMPNVEAPDLHTWKEQLAAKRLARAQFEQGQKDSFLKAVSNWYTQRNEWEKMNQKNLETWQRALQKRQDQYNKEDQEYAKMVTSYYKDKSATERAKFRTTHARSGGSRTSYHFNGGTYSNVREYNQAILIAANDWNKKHPNDQITLKEKDAYGKEQYTPVDRVAAELAERGVK